MPINNTLKYSIDKYINRTTIENETTKSSSKQFR